jgi:hypothetical protein
VPQIKKERRTWRAEPGEQPAFGGTLNATTSDAEEEKREEELSRRNKELLSHDGEEAPATEPVPEPPTFEIPAVPAADTTPEPAEKPLESSSDELLQFEPAPIATEPKPEGQTLADLDEQLRGKAADDARAAVDAALSAMPFDPAGNPVESVGAAPVFEISHDQQPVPPVPSFEEPIAPTPVPAEQPLAPPMQPAEPVGLPPLPDFSTLPPLPGEPTPAIPETDTTQVPSDPALGLMNEPPLGTPPPTDPGQFKIPGQS